MAGLRHFEEFDFDEDFDSEEEFSKFLSDEDFENESENESVDNESGVNMNFEKADIVELPDDIEIPPVAPQKNEETSLLDSLLGEALSGEQVNPSIEGLFDDLDLSDEEPQVINRRLLEDEDSGISTGPSRSDDTEISQESSSKIPEPSSIEKYLRYISEEEHEVSVDDIPDFASKKNVYGTSFNVRTGNISRPPRFEFARRDDRWINSCKLLTYDNEKPLNELLSLGKLVPTVKAGMKLNYKSCKFTDVHCRSAQEMSDMETHDIQQIIRDAFNSRRLAVILFGVDKDGIVTGCQMNAGKQDNLRLALDTAIQTEFVPPIENILDAVDVQFLPVENLGDMFLIVIRIKQIRNQHYRLESSV
ncbi:hypothetical protein L5515_008808 [Caenorhabditis briggsae]|uniref:Uncharacterized protein n=1 Tax=Caenorhabditis briggsae TaxID=6238 RepID=A0AAE9F1Z8_CAEBR|nr:hypothetical protein L5515_008808 [Caenorhabditis briggsae]